METHTTVLLAEAVDALAITRDSVIVDATLGAMGHTKRIIDALGKEGVYIGIDADPVAIHAAEALFSGDKRVHLTVGNFRDINSIVNAQKIEQVDGILADLGWRMEQFSGNGKGFSFQIDEPLIMTFGEPEKYPFTAYDIVNTWDAENIESILSGYGEERYARRIAHGIVNERVHGEIKTTFDLLRVIESSVPRQYVHGKIHPATRTFQALRITVNDELGALEAFLSGSIKLLKSKGRLAIITFHSLEDRIVKHTFKAYTRDQQGILITKKPLLPSREEINANKRARSAKLRIFEKT